MRCQRWRWRRHSWRHTSDGGFDPARYDVDTVDDTTAKSFVTDHHYTGSYVAAKHRFGLYDGTELVGAAVFSVPPRREVLTNPFPTLQPYDESIELGRFVLLDEVPANAETWFLARCFDQLADRGVRGVVAFCDPVPRTRADGTVLMPGHVGTIYQAKGGVCTAGRSNARPLLIGPDGRALNPRALQKIRAGETGTRYAEQLLVEWGAAPRGDADPKTWLLDAVAAANLRTLAHPGNYRYCFTLGRTRRDRDAVVIAMPARSYPKRNAA